MIRVAICEMPLHAKLSVIYAEYAEYTEYTKYTEVTTYTEHRAYTEYTECPECPEYLGLLQSTQTSWEMRHRAAELKL